VINVEFAIDKTDHFLCISDSEYEVVVPKDELSWASHVEFSKYDGIKSDVLIYRIVKEDGLILGSIKRHLKNPWTNINSIYPRGSIVKAEVQHVNEYGVYFILPNGLNGFLRKENILVSQTNEKMIKGNQIDVVIEKVLASKNRIYLSLPS